MAYSGQVVPTLLTRWKSRKSEWAKTGDFQHYPDKPAFHGSAACGNFRKGCFVAPAIISSI